MPIASRQGVAVGPRQCELAAKTTGHICLVVYSSGGFRQLANAQRPVHVPADMKGIKWRVTKSPIEYTLIKNWGAVPVPYDWTQLYQGLQTGRGLRPVCGRSVAAHSQAARGREILHRDRRRLVGQSAGDGHHPVQCTERPGKGMAAHGRSIAFGKKVRELDRKWVEDGETAIKAAIKEWYTPTDAELAEQWRKPAPIDAWIDAKGTFDPEMAERILEGSGHGRLHRRAQEGRCALSAGRVALARS